MSGFQLFDQVPFDRSSLFRVACFTPPVFAFVDFESVFFGFVFCLHDPASGSTFAEPLEDFPVSFDVVKFGVCADSAFLPKTVTEFGFEVSTDRGL